MKYHDIKSAMTTMEDHPTCFIICKSGWSDKYHIIIENIEEGDYNHEHHFLSKENAIGAFPELKEWFDNVD